MTDVGALTLESVQVAYFFKEPQKSIDVDGLSQRFLNAVPESIERKGSVGPTIATSRLGDFVVRLVANPTRLDLVVAPAPEVEIEIGPLSTPGTAEVHQLLDQVTKLSGKLSPSLGKLVRVGVIAQFYRAFLTQQDALDRLKVEIPFTVDFPAEAVDVAIQFNLRTQSSSSSQITFNNLTAWQVGIQHGVNIGPTGIQFVESVALRSTVDVNTATMPSADGVEGETLNAVVDEALSIVRATAARRTT